jgi:mRNA interferase MazF
VIIVSREAINQNSTVVICVPCTDAANLRHLYPSQVLLKQGTAGLAMDSVAMCEQVRAITVGRLKIRIGRLDRHALNAIDVRLKIALDLE